jgi:hypothetical protein
MRRILTGNGSAAVGSRHGTLLQAQRDGAASSRIPLQGGGLANGEAISIGGNLKWVGHAASGSNSRKSGDSQVDDRAHGDSKELQGLEMKQGGRKRMDAITGINGQRLRECERA